MPQTISKVSAFNGNNKIFPVLEYYTCTPEEKIAFAKKLAFNGMTTMVIDTLRNYLTGGTPINWQYQQITEAGRQVTVDNKKYFKGKLIRMDN